MKKRLQTTGLLQDDQGVAMTEFAIIMPVLLLCFFAMMEFFDIARTAQMGNYAAYVAARSYAVLQNQDLARKAAAMAFAPTARRAPGELPYIDTSVIALGSGPLALLLGNNASSFLTGFGRRKAVCRAGT